MSEEKLKELKKKLLEVVERKLNTEEKIRNIDLINELLKIVEREYDL